MASAPASVLVVDDEPALREVLSDLLESDGYAVRTAENGAAALDRLRDHRPDVVVLDLMMPVLDGWAFMQTYREVAGCDIPIVGTSAVMTAETAERLRELGVRVCLAKPFDLGELLECLHSLVDDHATPATGAGQAGLP